MFVSKNDGFTKEHALHVSYIMMCRYIGQVEDSKLLKIACVLFRTHKLYTYD